MAATAEKKRLEFSAIIQWFGLIVLLIGCIYLAAQVKQQSRQLVGLNRLVVSQRVHLNRLQKQVAVLGDTLGIQWGVERASRKTGNKHETTGGTHPRRRGAAQDAAPGKQERPASSTITEKTTHAAEQPREDAPSVIRRTQDETNPAPALQARRPGRSAQATVPRRFPAKNQAAAVRSGMQERGYALITGQFSARTMAVAEQQQLLAKGYPARVHGRNGRWSVSIGTFEHPHTARSYKAALERDLPGRSAAIVYMGK